MRQILAAVAERIIPRLAPALLLVLLGILTSPTSVGLYSLAVLGYTLVQAVSEGAVRQLLPQAITSSAGLEFLHGYRRFIVAVAPAVLLIYIAIIVAAAGAGFATFLALAPVAIAPVMSTFGIVALGRLQVAGAWGTLARGQMIASLAGTVLGLALLGATESPIGASMALVTIELTVALWNRAHVGVQSPAVSGSFDRKQLNPLIAYATTAWLQAQSDRLFIGAVGGAAVLGKYSMGISLSRSAGEAAAAAIANILRSRTAIGPTDPKSRDRLLYAGLGIGVVGTAILVAVALFTIVPLLGPSWTALRSVIPVLALCAIPSVLNWSAVVLHVSDGRASRALIGPILGIGAGVAIGFASGVSLELAAWFCVLREIVLLTATYSAMGARAPWKPYGAALAITVAFIPLVLMLRG